MNNKETLIRKLHQLLADIRLLTIKTQMYHWNVKSYNFYSFHKMFQKHYEDLFDFQDIVAELIRIQGAFVNFNKINMDASSLPYDNMNELKCKNMLFNLINDYKILENNIKETILVAQDEGEESVVNDLSEILGKIQKHCWFIKSHCE